MTGGAAAATMPAMLFESPHVRVSAEPGVATLWLDFPGRPVNALSPARLNDVARGLAVVAANASVHTLIVRSARPAGFVDGFDPAAVAALATDADRAAFAAAGQRAFAALEATDAVTVAFVDGPCVGAGLELALACDYRLALARPDTVIGFTRGQTPCWGGTHRLARLVGRHTAARLLESGEMLSGREATRVGLFDHAFCERRAKIELRTWLDRLDLRPHKPRRGRWWDRLPARGQAEAAERRRFAAAPPRTPAVPAPCPLPLPAVVAVDSRDTAFARLAADFAVRGTGVLAAAPTTAAHVRARIGWWLARGFVTPLEADQASARVSHAPGLAGVERAGLILADASGAWLARVRPAAVVAFAAAPDAHPRRSCVLHLADADHATLTTLPDTDAATASILAGWLGHLRLSVAHIQAARVSVLDRPPTTVHRPPATIPA